MDKIKIIGISGSLRKKSYNTALLKNIKNMFNETIDMEIVDISNIPFFSEDIEEQNIESVSILSYKIKASDGLIIASPEYNYSISGVLKNTIDFLSRVSNKPLNDKKVAILSASIGLFGGSRMQYDLRKVLLCLNSDVIRKPEVFITDAANKFDNNGILIDEKAIEKVSLLINSFIEEIKK